MRRLALALALALALPMVALAQPVDDSVTLPTGQKSDMSKVNRAAVDYLRQRINISDPITETEHMRVSEGAAHAKAPDRVAAPVTFDGVNDAIYLKTEGLRGLGFHLTSTAFIGTVQAEAAQQCSDATPANWKWLHDGDPILAHLLDPITGQAVGSSVALAGTEASVSYTVKPPADACGVRVIVTAFTSGSGSADLRGTTHGAGQILYVLKSDGTPTPLPLFCSGGECMVNTSSGTIDFVKLTGITATCATSTGVCTGSVDAQDEAVRISALGGRVTGQIPSGATATFVIRGRYGSGAFAEVPVYWRKGGPATFPAEFEVLVTGHTEYEALASTLSAGSTDPVLTVVSGDTPISGYSGYTTISTAAVLSAVIKDKPGQVLGVSCFNTNAAARYVRLYNQVGAPGTGDGANIKWRGACPGNTAGSGFVMPLPPGGLDFPAGIGIRATTGIGDADTGVLAADELIFNVQIR